MKALTAGADLENSQYPPTSWWDSDGASPSAAVADVANTRRRVAPVSFVQQGIIFGPEIRAEKPEGRRQKAEGRRQKADGSVYTPYRPVIRHCIRRRRSSADAVRFGTKSVSESVIFRKHTHTVQAAMSMGIMERPRRRHMLLRIQHNHEPECTFNEIAPLAV